MMKLNPDTGLVDGVEFIPSPNSDPRPPGTETDLLVIHSISLPPGQFGGDSITNLFTNQLDPGADPFFADIVGLKVSAHFLICRSGHLLQFVPTTLRAWHAGVSSFQGRSKCNDFSIGIELEGTDTSPFEDAQYKMLTWLTREIQYHYPCIDLTRIVGHSDIAPGRKTDPGTGFDWDSYRQMLTE